MFADVLEEAVRDGDADQQPAYLISRLKAAIQFATADAKPDADALSEAREYAQRLLMRKDIAPDNRRRLLFIETMISAEMHTSLVAVKRTANELCESLRGSLTERVEPKTERSLDEMLHTLLIEGETK